MSNEVNRPHLVIESPSSVQPRVYSGGGGGTYPRASYARHAAKVYAEAQKIEQFISSRADAARTDRRYFRMELPSDESTWTSTARKLAEALKGEIVGAPSKTVGHVSTTESGLKLALEELKRYAAPKGTGKSKFAILEALAPIPAAEKISDRAREALTQGDSGDFLLALFPDLTSREKQSVTQAVRIWLQSSQGIVVSTTDVESGFYLRVQARPKAIEQIAELFLTVQSVDPVEYSLELSSRKGHKLDSQLQVVPSKSQAMACVFDSGVVKGSRYLDASIIDREEPLGPPYSTDHGSFVASRVIYGDTLRDQEAAGVLIPEVRVLSVCTATYDDIGNRKSASTEELMRLIRDTVQRWHKQIRVYNISQNLIARDLSVDCTIADDVVGPLASELDKLARRYNVLFVLTSGNYPRPGEPNPPQKYPHYFSSTRARLLPPGEAVLALTVGSIAQRANAGSLAPQGAPSPFTRRGPGFAAFRKPDLVAHGGNYGQNWQATDDLATAGIGSHGDHLSLGCGTSYAAPLITRLAAQLFDSVPDATPELVRALMVHFAAFPSDVTVSNLDDLVGNGQPDGPRLLQSTQWSQTFVHTSDLPHREIRYIDFYVPKALCSRSGKNRVTIRATVACTPETDRTLKAGYCKSNVRCKLVKRDAKGQLKEVQKNDGDTVLRNRYAGLVRLEKTFSSHLTGGYWRLLMEHESRWTLKDKSLPVAAVLTVEDPRNDPQIDILAAIRTEVPNQYRTTLATPVALRV